MSTIDISNLAFAIAEELQRYSEKVSEEVKNAVDITAEEVNLEIKKHVTFEERSGKYVKAFRLKTSYEDKTNKRVTWHVASGQHRLTHLLENGHALKGGGRTKAYPHIKYGEVLAQKRIEELAREAVVNANKY